MTEKEIEEKILKEVMNKIEINGRRAKKGRRGKMNFEPYVIPNYVKSKSGLQFDLGVLTKDEFNDYCKRLIRKLKTNYKIRKNKIRMEEEQRKAGEEK